MVKDEIQSANCMHNTKRANILVLVCNLTQDHSGGNRKGFTCKKLVYNDLEEQADDKERNKNTILLQWTPVMKERRMLR